MILQSNKPLFHTLAELETGPETEPRAEPRTFSDGRTGFGAHVSSADTYDDSQFSVLIVYITCYVLSRFTIGLVAIQLAILLRTPCKTQSQQISRITCYTWILLEPNFGFVDQLNNVNISELVNII
jgi:hypothetical protein